MVKIIVNEHIDVAGSPAKPNEDRVGFNETCAFVIDGATGKTPLRHIAAADSSDTAWLSETAKDFLLAQPGIKDPQKTFWDCNRHLARQFDAGKRLSPENPWEFPSASVILAYLAQQQLILASLGDCSAILRMKNGDIFTWQGDPAHKAVDARILRLAGDRTPPDALMADKRQSVIEDIRQDQSLLNQPHGYGSLSIASPDPRGNTITHAFPAAAIDAVLLMSDGFFSLSEDYGKYAPPELIAAAETQGLQALTDEIRAVEGIDPEGATYPRLKKSDDASAILFRLQL